ncbi:MAG: trypsin-like peptidase domain-containing protein [Saprospiraceae bacterium]|nr:trypsin-like peptidase domain-containing protein [Saprospiraceae bacterium]
MTRQLFLFIFLLSLLVSCKKESKLTVNSLKTKFIDAEVYNELLRRDAENNKGILSDTLPVPFQNELSEYAFDTLYKYYVEEVIYGEDDRYNVYEQIITPELKNDADKVACLIKKDKIQLNADSTYSLVYAKKFGDTRSFCDKEKFVKEPVISFCSGFAVSEKLFITAGHCVDYNTLGDFFIVYGYRMNSENAAITVINKNDIYEPVGIIKREKDGTKDYAVIQVKQPISKNRIAPYRKSGKISDKDTVHVIGHPSGLPLKVTLNANVYKNVYPNFFTINSDTYQGNSGSPVFNSTTHNVEGILVRGETDFRFDEIMRCTTSNICPINLGNCLGEDVTRVSQFINSISEK